MISNNVLVVDQDGNTSYSNMLTLDLRNYNFVKEIKNLDGGKLDNNYYKINTNKTYVLVCNTYHDIGYYEYNGFIIVDNKNDFKYDNLNTRIANIYFKYNPVYYSSYSSAIIYIGQLFVQYQTNNPGYIIPYKIGNNSTPRVVYGTVSVYESI